MESERLRTSFRTIWQITAVAAVGTTLIYFLRRRRRKNGQVKLESNKTKAILVNKEFFKELIDILRICFPGYFSRETLLLVLHSVSLVLRTFLSIFVAQLDGYIVKSIVERNPRRFVYNMIRLVLFAFPATFVNSLLRYLESKLALAFRTQLVKHAYNLYFSDEVYFKVGNLDNRLLNADHSMTEDLKNFSESVAHIYSHVSKPLLDLCMMGSAFVRLAYKNGGGGGKNSLLFAVSITFLTGVILKTISPPFGKLVAEEARRYGYLRSIHSRVIANAEEIAFYKGHQVRNI